MFPIPARVDALEQLVHHHAIQRGAPARTWTGEWSLETVAGRLVEISNPGTTAALTAATALVHEAQCGGESAAWITTCGATFHPPDVAQAGVDLRALPVVRVPGLHAGARAAEELLRSGAFAVVVLDLGAAIELPLAVQTRLTSLVQKHQTALLLLTRKPVQAPSLGSLVSLRVSGCVQRSAFDRFTWELLALKDKHLGPGWRHAEVQRGPDGLC
jgi:recombination protein RecA